MFSTEKQNLETTFGDNWPEGVSQTIKQFDEDNPYGGYGYMEITGDEKEYTLTYTTKMKNWDYDESIDDDDYFDRLLEYGAQFNTAYVETADGKEVGRTAASVFGSTGSVSKSFERVVSDDAGIRELEWKAGLNIPYAEEAGNVPAGITISEKVEGDGERHYFTQEQAEAAVAALKAEFGEDKFGTVTYLPSSYEGRYLGYEVKLLKDISAQEYGSNPTITYTTTFDTNGISGNETVKNTFKAGIHSNTAYYNYSKGVVKRGRRSVGGDFTDNDTSYISVDGTAEWQVEVNLNDAKNTENNFTITDTMPDGVTVTKVTVDGTKVYDAEDSTVSPSVQKWHSGGTSTWTTVLDGNNVVTKLTAGTAPAETKITIVYTCKVNDMPDTNERELFTLKNSVSVTDKGAVYDSAEQTTELDVDRTEVTPQKVSKTGSWNKDSQSLTYTVNLNAGEDKLGQDGSYRFYDKLSFHTSERDDTESGTSYRDIDLAPTSVKLYYGITEKVPNSDGRIETVVTRGSEVPADDWTWSNDTVQNGTQVTSTITMDVPDEKALVLVYVYDVNEFIKRQYDQNLGVTNTAEIEGYTDESAYHNEGNTKWEKSETSASFNKLTYQLIKVSETNYNQRLGGAEFDLYQYDSTAKKYNKVDLDPPLVTNEDGVIEIAFEENGRISPNIMYYVVETKAPSGYELPEKPELYYFYRNDPDAYAQTGIRHLPDPMPDDYVVIANKNQTGVIANRAIKKTTLPVTKRWLDEDGSTPIVPNAESIGASVYRSYRVRPEVDYENSSEVKIEYSSYGAARKLVYTTEKNAVYDLIITVPKSWDWRPEMTFKLDDGEDNVINAEYKNGASIETTSYWTGENHNIYVFSFNTGSEAHKFTGSIKASDEQLEQISINVLKHGAPGYITEDKPFKTITIQKPDEVSTEWTAEFTDLPTSGFVTVDGKEYYADFAYELVKELDIPEGYISEAVVEDGEAIITNVKMPTQKIKATKEWYNKDGAKIDAPEGAAITAAVNKLYSDDGVMVKLDYTFSDGVKGRVIGVVKAGSTAQLRFYGSQYYGLGTIKVKNGDETIEYAEARQVNIGDGKAYYYVPITADADVTCEATIGLASTDSIYDVRINNDGAEPTYIPYGVARTHILDASNNWTYTFTDLPIAENIDGTAKCMKYEIAEVGQYDGYMASVDDSDPDNVIIKNTEVDKEKAYELIINKKWMNKDGGEITPAADSVDYAVYKRYLKPAASGYNLTVTRQDKNGEDWCDNSGTFDCPVGSKVRVSLTYLNSKSTSTKDAVGWGFDAFDIINGDERIPVNKETVKTWEEIWTKDETNSYIYTEFITKGNVEISGKNSGHWSKSEMALGVEIVEKAQVISDNPEYITSPDPVLTGVLTAENGWTDKIYLDKTGIEDGTKVDYSYIVSETSSLTGWTTTYKVGENTFADTSEFEQTPISDDAVVDIINTAEDEEESFVLPETGGKGTLPYTVGGAFILIGAVLLYIKKYGGGQTV